MKIEGLYEQIKFDSLDREGMIQKHLQVISEYDRLKQRSSIMEKELQRFLKENYKLRNQQITEEQVKLVLEEQIEDLQDTVFGRKSERYKSPNKPSGNSNNDSQEKPKPKPRILKPSERYPNVEVVENHIKMDPIPSCQCCGSRMKETGMTEVSEQLTVIPKKYQINRTKREKYSCSKCYGAIETAPIPKKIKEGSLFSDDLIVDVALSKYCDLIPIERYVQIAARQGLVGLPPQSLIELTHHLADYFKDVYGLIKSTVFNSRVLHADETFHRMLEGSDKPNWYLWGFSTPEACYFEYHNTRASNVAVDILLNSNCEVLVSDAYTGYGKAIKDSNLIRIENNRPTIKSSLCNSHSRRYFFKAWKGKTSEAEFFLDHYQKIYELESQAKGKSPKEILNIRSSMKPFFEKMKDRALKDLARFPNNSKIAKAMKYFLSNYSGLTLFLTDPEIPIDNNFQESLLRSPVVGRKTWYGTHSKRGAMTAAILFSIVESCKLNKVNPREYFKAVVRDLHLGKKPYTPKDFLNLRNSETIS